MKRGRISDAGDGTLDDPAVILQKKEDLRQIRIFIRFLPKAVFIIMRLFRVGIRNTHKGHRCCPPAEVTGFLLPHQNPYTAVISTAPRTPATTPRSVNCHMS